jgi:hypothetical protein
LTPLVAVARMIAPAPRECPLPHQGNDFDQDIFYFPTGGEFIMSMHQYMPDQAVLADSWTLFCPECAQKMRIIMAAPAQDGKETRTFECISGHREWMTVALH